MLGRIRKKVIPRVWSASLVRRMTAWCQTGLDLLFPLRCTYCEADLGDATDHLLLCQQCRAALGPEEWPFCPRCGAPTEAEGPTSGPCERCRTARLKFDAVVSLGPYRGPLRDAVLRMKRPAGQNLARAMGQLLDLRRGVHLASLHPNLVIPVPMHWRRRWVQRVNSPETVAECLAEHLGIPAVGGILWRRRNTLPQAHLPPKQRFANVRDAFGLRPGHDIVDTHILLVDDILTTGATCSEAARVLKAAGAAQVSVTVLARAIGGHPA